ncbi:M56 family metallopeptidase [Gemmiger sp.]|uniref:M56 family metallopeptidase n=1 Tax=Gemmiger sp. TaxID=2049027 RepID=UPI003FD7915B
MYQAVFIAYLTQGLLLGLVVLALLAAVPKLQKRYGPRWLCRLWVTLAVLFLVPVRALVPQAPAAVSVSAAPLYTPVTVLQEETTQKPAGNVPYRTTTAADNTTHYIVPRTEIQTGRRTILERLAINTTRGNLAALVWELGILAVAVYQFGGYAVWRIRVGRNAQPVAKSWRDALPQGQCPQMQATPLVRSPMVAGALHPVLLVPAGEAPKGADCMLAHELTHIKRHDVAKKLLLTLVCILHWYNPAVWMLAARAGRDIEEACDAETLHGRDAAYRAAYADALMTAVRRNCGPALTSGFALSKRQLKQRLTALWDTAPKHRGRILLAVLALTACCAGGLVACKPADAGPQDEQEPAATAAPAPSGTANPIVTPEPPPVSMEAGAAAVRRGADFLWSEYLTDGNGYYYHGGACGLVEPEDYDTEYIFALLETRRDDGTTWRDYLNDGQGALVKATFEAELTPEGWYLGKQYGEGRFHVYLIAPFDESQPCEVISGWQSADDPNQSAHFEILPMARELDLTNNQYRMLLHQCNTLAQAGAQNFFNPGDWPQDELETYLYYRNRYFYDEADALLMLNVDFSNTADWNRLPDYLTYDELNALDFSAPKTAALPGYTPPESLESDDPGVWTFTREGLYITAEWPGVERYTFYVHNGNASLKFDARTICVQGQSLS